MSKYTSFVAMDKEVTRPITEPLIPIAQRIPLPDGVSRNALGDLSRTEIPPGDPFIEVVAPSDALRVTAFFPFGLVKDLTYDEGRGLWRGRFLVPAGIPDGIYKIVIAIETKEGEILYRQEVYHLDSKAENFVCNFKKVRVKAGRGILLKVDSIETADEVYAHSEALGIIRESLEPIDGDKRVDWSKWLKVDRDVEAGIYDLLVAVRDAAGNRLEQTIQIEVIP
jgi:Ca-activated chloride channel family protein